MRNATGMFAAIIAATSMLVLSGCVEQSAHGDVTTFRFERWLPITVLAGCFVGIPVAWSLRTRMARFGYGLLILIPIALLIAVPGLWCDRIAIDQRGFTCRTGFWFAPTRHQINFAELDSMRYVVDQGSRKQRRYKFILHLKSGGVRSIVAGDLMRHAVPAILQAATGAGVDARDQT